VKIAVIGGANVDILGRSAGALRREDSNPARLSLSCGGVARNIAENLWRLGAEVDFVSAVGDDGFGSFLSERLAETGIRSRLIRRPGCSTGLYLALFEPGGKLFIAVNDMEAVESIGPADVESLDGVFAAADLVIADANLRPDTLKALAAGGRPLMADAVSAAKAGRLRDILPRLRILKANRAEAEVLAGRDTGGTASGKTADDEEKLRALCMELLETGIEEIYITLGQDGCCCASAGIYRMLPALPAKTVNVNGAGDAFAAGTAYSRCRAGAVSDTPDTAAAFGLACAAITVESGDAVSEALTRERAETR
jgi:pseudouridine kinase